MIVKYILFGEIMINLILPAVWKSCWMGPSLKLSIVNKSAETSKKLRNEI